MTSNEMGDRLGVIVIACSFSSFPTSTHTFTSVSSACWHLARPHQLALAAVAVVTMHLVILIVFINDTDGVPFSTYVLHHIIRFKKVPAPVPAPTHIDIDKQRRESQFYCYYDYILSFFFSVVIKNEWHRQKYLIALFGRMTLVRLVRSVAASVGPFWSPVNGY